MRACNLQEGGSVDLREPAVEVEEFSALAETHTAK